jgi:hypothetical protein
MCISLYHGTMIAEQEAAPAPDSDEEFELDSDEEEFY